MARGRITVEMDAKDLGVLSARATRLGLTAEAYVEKLISREIEIGADLSDRVECWRQARCEVRNSTPATVLYESFSVWCREQQFDIPSQKAFGKVLAQIYRRGRRGTTTAYFGIGLRTIL